MKKWGVAYPPGCSVRNQSQVLADFYLCRERKGTTSQNKEKTEKVKLGGADIKGYLPINRQKQRFQSLKISDCNVDVSDCIRLHWLRETITIFPQSNKSVLDLLVVEYHLGMEDLATQVKKEKESSFLKITFNLFFIPNNDGQWISVL